MRLKSKFRSLVIPVFALVLMVTSCSKPTNWPQFRGSDGNMAVASANLPEKWDSISGILWTADLDGAGYSSPVVWGNKVFITSAFPEKVILHPREDQGRVRLPREDRDLSLVRHFPCRTYLIQASKKSCTGGR